MAFEHMSRKLAVFLAAIPVNGTLIKDVVHKESQDCHLKKCRSCTAISTEGMLKPRAAMESGNRHAYALHPRKTKPC